MIGRRTVRERIAEIAAGKAGREKAEIAEIVEITEKVGKAEMKRRAKNIEKVRI